MTAFFLVAAFGDSFWWQLIGGSYLVAAFFWWQLCMAAFGGSFWWQLLVGDFWWQLLVAALYEENFGDSFV